MDFLNFALLLTSRRQLYMASWQHTLVFASFLPDLLLDGGAWPSQTSTSSYSFDLLDICVWSSHVPLCMFAV
ncbi:hypothetical protein HETIRDRAFT_165886 [Heterobasidion irregulare TC 32-1]|uniref:Uncharacterized protein n=1 Tax=Heterobasidion irregulare (strain TC 32-1) TaxID=747525 RepID=W4KGA7_HETIT|nr:uncharacterized protein HETIRDRAFT_165886 [Heterobasidion irregulare TC 32-1]ETW84867.1 hypothetical protein HETIRDRAFT_165886 [Heterobasidion irregulare TC 32-1]